MNFFNFSKYNELEKVLFDKLRDAFINVNKLSHKEAKKAAEQILDSAIEKSKEEGTYNLPINFGNIILEIEETNDDKVNDYARIIRDDLKILKKEGVVDQDIKDWWNQLDLERHITLQQDLLNKSMVLSEAMQYKHMNYDNAAKEVIKKCPVFGYPSEIKKSTNDDRPLPDELHKRIAVYITRNKNINNNMSSFNAFIRKEMKNGNI